MVNLDSNVGAKFNQTPMIESVTDATKEIMFDKPGQTIGALSKAKGFAVTPEAIKDKAATPNDQTVASVAKDHASKKKDLPAAKLPTAKPDIVAKSQGLIVNRKPQVKVLDRKSPLPLEEIGFFVISDSVSTTSSQAVEPTRSQTSFTAVAMSPTSTISSEMQLEETAVLRENKSRYGSIDSLEETVLAILDDFAMWSFTETPKMFVAVALWLMSFAETGKGANDE